MFTRSRFALMLLVALAGCASAAHDAIPLQPELKLAAVARPADLFYARGPVSLDFDITITNPSDETIVLRRLAAKSLGAGGFTLRAEGNYKWTLAPRSRSTMRVTTWGNTRGGATGQTMPVDMQITAWFDSDLGSFTRIYTAHIFDPTGNRQPDGN